MEINKTEALKRLEAIEKEAAELRKIIDKPQLPTFEEIAKELRPKWLCDVSGDVRKIPFNDIYLHTHTSEASAERAKLRLEWELIFEWVNKGKLIDWNDESQDKWCLQYHHINKAINFVHASFIQTEHRTYFTSESDARKALEIMGESKWKKMNGII